MAQCGQMTLSMWPLGIGKINNINHFDFELPAKKVKSQSVHSQEQEAGDAFEKVSFPSGQKGMTQNNCWKRSFYLAHLLAPSSQGAKLCPWGCVEKTQSVLGMTALCIGQDGCGVSSPWSQHFTVLCSCLYGPIECPSTTTPTWLPQVPGNQRIFPKSHRSLLHLLLTSSFRMLKNPQLPTVKLTSEVSPWFSFAFRVRTIDHAVNEGRFLARVCLSCRTEKRLQDHQDCITGLWVHTGHSQRQTSKLRRHSKP